MTYFTVRGTATIEFLEKKSRFIGHISNISSRADAIDFIRQIRMIHPDANHNCTAFMVGNPASPTDIHFNDDGEPNGTAGKPMLQILQYKNIGDVVAVVTRYFGGKKLGTGGLVRAYTKAVKDGLDSAELISCVKKTTITISFDYQYEKTVRKMTEASGSEILSADYSEFVTFSVELVSDKMSKFCRTITEVSRGSAIIIKEKYTLRD
jgi:uncharacterized YigZ family protein